VYRVEVARSDLHLFHVLTIS